LDKIVNPLEATMWWLDLAYAPHLRPEGRRRSRAGCHGQSSGWPISLDKIVNPLEATMWWLDLAYAPHLRPEGRRRLFAFDALRRLFR
jgi:hypothetical protein